MPRREVRRGLPSRRAVAAARSTAEDALAAIRRRVRLRKAKSEDAAPLLALINAYASRGLLLRRSEESLRRHLADFTVAVQGGELVGCGSLEALATGLGEVRSLAVAEGHEGRGLGRRIVQHLLEGAGRRGFSQVLALTRRVSFFEGLGFEVTERERFLDKLAADCASCPMNACCDETAMVRTPLETRRHRDTEGTGWEWDSAEGAVPSTEHAEPECAPSEGAVEK